MINLACRGCGACMSAPCHDATKRLEVGAVIMAGGYGRRLHHLTRDTPKPMIPVAGRPTLEHVLDHLKKTGISEAVLSLHYLPHKIREHFGQRGGQGMHLQYSVSADDWGTAGSLLHAGDLIKSNPILVVSGDVITDMDLRRLLDFHRAHNSLFTMALTEVDDDRQYGIVQLDARDRVTRFIEKPKRRMAHRSWVNAGIYVIDRTILTKIPRGVPFDISRDLIPLLMEQGIGIHGCRQSGFWIDIGTPQTLKQAEEHFSQAELVSASFR